jgi:hypothetical protein
MEGGPDRNTAHAYTSKTGEFVLGLGTQSDAAETTADAAPPTSAELAQADQETAAERERLRQIDEDTFDSSPPNSGRKPKYQK